VPVAHEVEQAPGRGHQDVDPAAQGVDLRLLPTPPKMTAWRCAGVQEVAVGGEPLGDLAASSRVGREHECPDGTTAARGGLRRETLQDRESERGGLAGAGLGAAEEVAPAEQVRNGLRLDGGGEGLVMKLGQIASFMPGASSPEGQAVLARLQSKSTAMAAERVAEVIRAELGDAPEALFERWDTRPAASASIGQVHRASFGGREVAVKVQYPGIEDLVRSDLDTIGLLTKVSTFGTNVDGGALAEELRARILEECDYRLEAERQRLFCELLVHEGAAVPAGGARAQQPSRAHDRVGRGHEPRRVRRSCARGRARPRR
jgi:hypothetical protein